MGRSPEQKQNDKILFFYDSQKDRTNKMERINSQNKKKKKEEEEENFCGLAV